MLQVTNALLKDARGERFNPDAGGPFNPGADVDGLCASGVTFLVVDDEEPIRRMVSSVLSKKSGKVFVAADGEEALELLERHRPDVLITDVRMPGMDGLTLLVRVRSAAPEIEVALVTGFADKEVVIEALRAGASTFVEKPFGVASLLGHLRPLIDRVRLKRENERLLEERERERAQREEQARLAAMGRVLAGLAREILIPLDLATQGLEMARYEVGNKDQIAPDSPSSGGQAEEWLTEVGRCVQSIQDKVVTIEQFLDPSRPCRAVAARVADAVARAVSSAEHIRPRPVTMEVEIEEGLELKCDAVDLETCLNRLISNAYEALESKGSRLAVSGRLAGNGKSQVEIRVTDDGPGMSPELLSRALVPFFSTRPDAMGFGLPIAFEAARRNGGTLSVESTEGEGTTVTLRLPAATVQNAANSKNSTTSKNQRGRKEVSA